MSASLLSYVSLTVYVALTVFDVKSFKRVEFSRGGFEKGRRQKRQTVQSVACQIRETRFPIKMSRDKSLPIRSVCDLKRQYNNYYYYRRALLARRYTSDHSVVLHFGRSTHVRFSRF